MKKMSLSWIAPRTAALLSLGLAAAVVLQPACGVVCGAEPLRPAMIHVDDSACEMEDVFGFMCWSFEPDYRPDPAEMMTLSADRLRRDEDGRLLLDTGGNERYCELVYNDEVYEIDIPFADGECGDVIPTVHVSLTLNPCE